MTHTTTNIEKGKAWIWNACVNGSNKYFRFVNFRNVRNEYTEWMTPELAHKQAKGRTEYNTLRIEMKAY